jgi:hypothetical protein
MSTRDRNVHKVCFSLGGEDANREFNWSRIRGQANWYIVAKYLSTFNDALHYGLNQHHRSQCLRSRKIRIHSWHIFWICPIRVSVYTLPWSGNLPEKLFVPPILYKFPTFYGTWILITALTRPTICLYPQPDQSSPRQTIFFSWGRILVLSSHIRLGFPTEIPLVTRPNSICTSPLSHPRKMPRSL